MAIISIDGACKGNGTANCISAGGVFVVTEGKEFSAHRVHEKGSTNQRGELHALIKSLEIGLHLMNTTEPEIFFVTDSEYIFNTITKEWYKNWENKGWITSTNEPVKNKDLWLRASEMLGMYYNNSYEFNFYHIKGHVMPFGKVTAYKLMQKDPSCESLYNEVYKKFDLEYAKAPYRVDNAKNLFERNHGFEAPPERLKQFIVHNIVVDLVASLHVESLVNNK
jgi:ribonuclease HI